MQLIASDVLMQCFINLIFISEMKHERSLLHLGQKFATSSQHFSAQTARISFLFSKFWHQMTELPKKALHSKKREKRKRKIIEPDAESDLCICVGSKGRLKSSIAYGSKSALWTPACQHRPSYKSLHSWAATSPSITWRLMTPFYQWYLEELH